MSEWYLYHFSYMYDRSKVPFAMFAVTGHILDLAHVSIHGILVPFVTVCQQNLTQYIAKVNRP